MGGKRGGAGEKGRIIEGKQEEQGKRGGLEKGRRGVEDGGFRGRRSGKGNKLRGGLEKGRRGV